MNADRIRFKLELVKHAVRGLVLDDFEEGVAEWQRDAVFAIEQELDDIVRAVDALALHANEV